MWQTDLERYRLFCELHQASLPIFYQPWWLDASCADGIWLPFISSDNAAIFPIHVKSKWGISYIILPPLTYKLGVWASNGDAGDHQVELFKVLPKVQSLLLKMPKQEESKLKLALPSSNICEVFYYSIEQPLEGENWKSTISKDAIRNIKRAQKTMTLHKNFDPSVLADMAQKSLIRIGETYKFPGAALIRLANACAERNYGSVWAAIDDTGAVHATAFLVWDAKTTYYIAAGLDDNVLQLGAPRWLIYKAMEEAAAAHRSINFCGGMAPRVGRIYRSMGATQQDYLQVEYYPSKLLELGIKSFQKLRNIAR